MESITEFFNCEKTLYLCAGIFGIASVIAGLIFLLMPGHKSFAITMLVIGVLEIGVMFPAYFTYQKKADLRVSSYTDNKKDFLEKETTQIEKALRSFFWLKLVYGIMIVALILFMPRLGHSSVFHGIFTALIIHLAIAITIDNFGEKFSKKYQVVLREMSV